MMGRVPGSRRLARMRRARVATTVRDHGVTVTFDVETAEWRIITVGTPGVAVGPKAAWHPTVGVLCPVCGEAFRPGDLTAVVALGPATDRDRARCKRGDEFEAIGQEVHARCTGREREPCRELTAAPD